MCNRRWECLINESSSMWDYKHAYIFINGVSDGWGIGDAVLCDGAFSVVPAHGERTGGGVIHTKVPWSTAGHWAREKKNELCVIFFTHDKMNQMVIYVNYVWF